MTVSPLRAAVIGAGHMGNYHAQKLVTLDGVELVAVVDADLLRARAIAAKTSGAAYADYRELLSGLDCAFIATPTEHHHRIARDCLNAGVHVLIEKPITNTVAQARELVALAEQRGLVVQVGHAERFNAAFTAAQSHLQTPRYIEAHRLSPFRGRSTDIDVVLDLMIHDIDLTLALVAARETHAASSPPRENVSASSPPRENVSASSPPPVKELHAMGSRVLTDQVDIANARIAFANGCVATLTASRVSTKAMRKIRGFAPHLYVSVDCMNHSLTLGRTGEPAQGEAAIVVEDKQFDQKDSLLAQAQAFIDAVRGESAPRVSGADGVRALELALSIKEKVAQSMREFG
jgi:predicted dehydrogenase